MTLRRNGPVGPEPYVLDEMHRLGQHVAGIARDAKKYGLKSNLKSPVMTNLRWAINLGMDDYEDEIGRSSRPETSQIAAWVDFRASELLSETAHLRRSGKLYEFGAKVTAGLKAAYKKGRELAAGQGELEGVTKKTTSNEVLAEVPARYRDMFYHLCHEKLFREDRALVHGYQKWTRTFTGKSFFRKVDLVQHPQGEDKVIVKLLEDKGEDISEGFLESLIKRDLVHYGVLGDEPDAPVIYVISEKGMRLFARAFEAKEKEREAYERTPRGLAMKAHLESIYPGSKSPSLNSGIPERLKAYFDHIERVKRR